MITNKGKILELIIANSKDPSKAAFRLHSGEVLTYGELIHLEDKTRSAFEEFNIKPYERISLITDDSLMYLPLTLAILETATYVPLDTALTAEQFSQNYQLLSIDYLLTDQITGPTVEAAEAYGMGVIYFQVKDKTQPSTLEFKVLYKSKLVSNQDYKNDQTAYVMTTSGTTSEPKIVPMLYSNFVACLELEAEYLEHDENSVQIVVVKISHFASIRGMLLCLIANGRSIYTDGIHPKRIADALLEFPITGIQIPPAGLFAVYEYFVKSSIEYTQQQHMNILLYGAPLPIQVKDDIEKRFHAKLIDNYGMTEVGFIASTFKAPKGYRRGSVGYPMYLEVKILDNEVLVKGVGVFPGYENNPDANRDSFVDGWFRTGDIGYFDEDGYLFIQGRIRELINRGGEKVSPFEVEQALLSLGNIKDVSVFPYPNKQGSDSVGAIIVPAGDSSLSLREIRSALKEKIRPFKLPTLLYTVNEIPASANVKVQRNSLYRQLRLLNLIPETLKSHANHFEPILTPTELTIQKLWQNILEQEFVAPDDNFFDIGGDSLSAAELLAAIETSFGCVLPVNQFFQKSTIRELAELVEQAPKMNEYKHLVPIRPEGTKTPLFLVHEISGDVVTYQYVAEHIDTKRPVYGLKLSFQKDQWDKSITLTKIAHTYVDEIRQLVPTGPYYLGGLSIGGTIAFEMAQILNQRGYSTMVFMIDTFSRGYIRMGIRRLFKPAFAEIKTASLQEMPRLVWKKTITLINVLRETIQSKIALQHREPINGKCKNLDSESKKGSDFLAFITSKYQPKFYPGEIYYFRALHKKINSSYDDWKSLSRKCALIQKNCGHSDFVKPEYAQDTANEINLILREY